MIFFYTGVGQPSDGRSRRKKTPIKLCKIDIRIVKGQIARQRVSVMIYHQVATVVKIFFMSLCGITISIENGITSIDKWFMDKWSPSQDSFTYWYIMTVRSGMVEKTGVPK